MDGFSARLGALSERIFGALGALDAALAEGDRFGRLREAMERKLRNAHLKPLKHATYLRLLALRQTAWPVEATLAAVQRAAAADVARRPPLPRPRPACRAPPQAAIARQNGPSASTRLCLFWNPWT